jgi:hypothetical protein
LLRWGLHNFSPGLNSIHDTPNLTLPSSWDCRHEPLHLTEIWVFLYWIHMKSMLASHNDFTLYAIMICKHLTTSFLLFFYFIVFTLTCMLYIVWATTHLHPQTSSFQAEQVLPSYIWFCWRENMR